MGVGHWQVVPSYGVCMPEHSLAVGNRNGWSSWGNPWWKEGRTQSGRISFNWFHLIQISSLSCSLAIPESVFNGTAASQWVSMGLDQRYSGQVPSRWKCFRQHCYSITIWVEYHLWKEIHNSSFSSISCYPWNTTKACCGLNTCVRRNANYLKSLSMTQVTLDSAAWGMTNAWAYAQKRGLSGCLQQEQYPLVVSLFTPNTQVHYHLSRIWDPGKTNKPKKGPINFSLEICKPLKSQHPLLIAMKHSASTTPSQKSVWVPLIPVHSLTN